ncbi:phage terminase small subunit [Beduini massiliensis]|uniref:phage terminase small subunit n=1 Tax=Beduini massiliensis TaxID=1585974 RepID=UPI00059A9125|nr:phage terminase small subunit [Beduini massiliensis]
MKENWELAYEDYLNGLKYKDIAEKYNVSINTVKSWKTRYWNKKSMHTKSKKVCTQKKNNRGAPLNNKNALNNQGGAPPQNTNAEKHGFFSKWLPEETLEILGEVKEKSSLDLLWDNIQLQYAAIIRAQKLMYVKDQQDMTKEISLASPDTTAYDVQQAWDKQANFMSAQSRAMKTLESMIKQYDEMLHKDWQLATEEQKARIASLKAKLDDGDDDPAVNDGFIEALNGTAQEDWEDEKE